MTRVFNTAAGFLEEGSLETRTYGKRILWSVQRFLTAGQLASMKAGCGNDARQRKVGEALEGLGPPEAPVRVANSLARFNGTESMTGSPIKARLSGAGAARDSSVSSEIYVDSTSLVPPRWKNSQDGDPRMAPSPIKEGGAGSLTAPLPGPQRTSFKGSSTTRRVNVKSGEGMWPNGDSADGLADSNMIVGRSVSRRL